MSSKFNSNRSSDVDVFIHLFIQSLIHSFVNLFTMHLYVYLFIFILLCYVLTLHVRIIGVQLWHHHAYDQYRCHDPYVPEWGCCSASWHPSKLGHELRASHYSFFWLSIYYDALRTILYSFGTEQSQEEVYSNHSINHSLQSLTEQTEKHFNHESKHVQEKAIFPSEWSDNMNCMTAFEPIADNSSVLYKYIINNDINKPYFVRGLFEDLLDGRIIKKARPQKYLDFKYTHYGNNMSKPLSIKISVKAIGISFLCQPPGVWGKYPDGYKFWWLADTKIFLTKNVPDLQSKESYKDFDGDNDNGTFSGKINDNVFKFNEKESQEIKYTSNDPLCGQFTEKFPIGDHVLTIIPTTNDKILVSYLLTP